VLEELIAAGAERKPNLYEAKSKNGHRPERIEGFVKAGLGKSRQLKGWGGMVAGRNISGRAGIKLVHQAETK